MAGKRDYREKSRKIKKILKIERSSPNLEAGAFTVLRNFSYYDCRGILNRRRMEFIREKSRVCGEAAVGSGRPPVFACDKRQRSELWKNIS